MSTGPEPQVGSRYVAVDVARGLAILAMVAYHAAWDADFLGLAPTGFFEGWGWVWFRAGILGSFLFLVGVGLVLAHGHGFRARPFLRRLFLVAAGAGLVTAVSALAFRQHMIVFGVLHCIAVSSVLALPFLRLPWIANAVAAIAVIAAAGFVIPAFDEPALGWIGFMASPPASRDFVPLSPWFGVVLAGIAAAQHGWPQKLAANWQPANKGARWLALGGRRSLAIYLLHQPLLFLVLAGIAFAVLPAGKLSLGGGGAIHSAAYARSFTGACQRRCVEGGLSATQCAAYCQCMLIAVRRNFTATDLNPKTITPQNRTRLRALGRQCLARGSLGSGGSAPK